MQRKQAYLVLGTGEVFSVLKDLAGQGRLRISIDGFFEDPARLPEDLSSFTVLYAGGCAGKDELASIRSRCSSLKVISLSYSDMLLARALNLEDCSYTRFVKVERGIWYPVIKRLFDMAAALCGIIITAPVMLIVAVLVRAKLGAPIVFSQIRPGRHEKIFRVYKFRSMSNAKDENGELLPDDVRLTKFGKVLRSTSLDELPQLFSIFTGKMSLIGPRPQSFENVYFMTARQRLRHAVTPGLTGWSQVNGRNAIPWDEKIQYDLDYVEQKITFARDAKIFFRTVAIVLLRKNITQVGSVSTESVGEFRVRTNMIGDMKYHQMRAEAREWEYRKAAEIKRGGDPHE